MKRVQFSLRQLLLFQLALPVVLVALSCCFVINFRYTRFVENDPLRNPQAVQRVDGDRLYLGDGRWLNVEANETELLERIESSGHVVDVERIDDSEVCLHVKEQHFLCALPPDAWIYLPLIADDVPSNHRVFLGNALVCHDCTEKPFPFAQ